MKLSELFKVESPEKSKILEQIGFEGRQLFDVAATDLDKSDIDIFFDYLIENKMLSFFGIPKNVQLKLIDLHDKDELVNMVHKEILSQDTITINADKWKIVILIKNLVEYNEDFDYNDFGLALDNATKLMNIFNYSNKFLSKYSIKFAEEFLTYKSANETDATAFDLTMDINRDIVRDEIKTELVQQIENINSLLNLITEFEPAISTEYVSSFDDDTTKIAGLNFKNVTQKLDKSLMVDVDRDGFNAFYHLLMGYQKFGRSISNINPIDLEEFESGEKMWLATLPTYRTTDTKRPIFGQDDISDDFYELFPQRDSCIILDINGIILLVAKWGNKLLRLPNDFFSHYVSLNESKLFKDKDVDDLYYAIKRENDSDDVTPDDVKEFMSAFYTNNANHKGDVDSYNFWEWYDN